MTQTPTKTKLAPLLTIERVFKATPEKLWRYWTDPELYARWFNPAPRVDLGVRKTAARPGAPTGSGAGPDASTIGLRTWSLPSSLMPPPPVHRVAPGTSECQPYDAVRAPSATACPGGRAAHRSLGSCA